MSYRPTMAEAQAIGLCWLARQKGLPEVVTIRAAVAQMHATSCGWCEYPDGELLRMCVEFNETRTASSDGRWNALPARAKGEAIRLAQGEAAA